MFSKNAYGECLRSFARIGVGKEWEGGTARGGTQEKGARNRMGSGRGGILKVAGSKIAR